MKKTNTSLLLLSAFLLLASCGEGGASSSSVPAVGPSDSSGTSLAPEPGVSTPSDSTPEPEPTAEERFKASFDAYVKNTLERELSATAATFVDEGKTYAASFFKGQAVQKNPGDVTLVRSIEGNQYLQYRFSGETLVDFSKTEIIDSSRKETQKKISTIFANNAYGAETLLDELQIFARGGEGLSYDYQNGAYTLVSESSSEAGAVQTSYRIVILDEAISQWSRTISTFAQAGDHEPIFVSFSSLEWQFEGEKTANPNAYLESDYCFADYEPKLVTEDGHYYVGNSYSAEFLSTVNPKASVLVDPIGHLLPEDNGILSYDEKTETFKVLKAGEVEIPFVSSRGVSKTLRVQTEDKPILGIRADQEDGQVEAGSSIPLSATILPAIPANAGKYTAEITSGQTEADLSKGENGGYVLSVHPDAETGATIVVTFTSVGVKEDGEKAVTTNVFTVKAAQTGGLEELLVGSWQDDGYPASTLTFNSDKTGFVEYNSWSGAYYFKFTWNDATETALADEGSFVEVDEFGEPGPDNFFVLSSFRYENASIVLEFEYEGPLVFAKVGS